MTKKVKVKYKIINKNGKRYVKVGSKLIRIEGNITERELIKYIIGKLHRKRKARKDNGVTKPKATSSSSSTSDALLVAQINRGNQEAKDKIKDLENKIKSGAPQLPPAERLLIQNDSPNPAPSNHEIDLDNGLVLFKQNGKVEKRPLAMVHEMVKQFDESQKQAEQAKKVAEEAKQNEEQAKRMANEAKQKEEQANKVAEDAQKRAQNASEQKTKYARTTAEARKTFQQNEKEKQKELTNILRSAQDNAKKKASNLHKIQYKGTVKDDHIRELMAIDKKYNEKELKKKTVDELKQLLETEDPVTYKSLATIEKAQMDEYEKEIKKSKEYQDVVTEIQNIQRAIESISNNTDDLTTPKKDLAKEFSKDEVDSSASNSMYDPIIQELDKRIAELGLEKMVKPKGSYKSKQQESEEKQKLVDDFKQLGDGRMSGPLSNFDIDDIMKKYGNRYLGTIAHDEIISKVLPNIQPLSEGCFIMNLDNHNLPGSHWIAVYFDGKNKKEIDYFDSFGRNPDEKTKTGLKAIADKLNTNGYIKLKVNKIQKQDNNSNTCGWHSIKFCIDMLNGKHFTSSSGFDDHVKGEKNVEQFKHQMGYGEFEFLPSFGSGIIDTIKEGFNRFKNIIYGRSEPPPAVKKLIETHGDANITSINVYRTPIIPIIKNVLNLLSEGQLNENQKKLNYDDLYHLALVIKLDDGYEFLIEKNEDVNVKSPSVTSDTEIKNVPMNGKINLAQFIANGTKSSNIWNYNPISSNCQMFISSLLKGNGLMNAELNTFINQDSVKLLENMPLTTKIASSIADFKQKLNILIGGKKVKRAVAKKRCN